MGQSGRLSGDGWMIRERIIWSDPWSEDGDAHQHCKDDTEEPARILPYLFEHAHGECGFARSSADFQVKQCRQRPASG
jgi:hypothetical protein